MTDRDLFLLGRQIEREFEQQIVQSTIGATVGRPMTMADLDRAYAMMRDIENSKPMLVGQQSALDTFWTAYRRAIADAPDSIRAVFRPHVYDQISDDRLLIFYGKIPDVKVAIIMLEGL